MEFVLSCAWTAVVAWLIFRALNQRNILQQIDSSPALTDPIPKLAVIVPARDEETDIAGCLRSLLSQTYPRPFVEIFMVDDHSSDATCAIGRSLASCHPHLHVLEAPELPPRWIGKSYACWVATAAVPAETEWLCFLDADVKAAPELLTSAVAKAVADSLDMLSLTPRQELGSFAERLVIPCGSFFMAFRQNLRKLQSPACADATVSGKFILVRASAYNHIGGHKAVHAAICEDIALARRLKCSGYRVILHDGAKLISTRMYTGWQTLWPGLTKNLMVSAGGPLATVLFAIVVVALSWAALWVPIGAAWNCARGDSNACLGLVPAAAASAGLFGLHIAGSRYFGIPLWYGLLFPFGYTAGAAIAVDSLRRHLHRRVNWKGRIYPSALS